MIIPSLPNARRDLATPSTKPSKGENRRKLRGFTMLEVLVVGAIMVGMIALIAPAVTGITRGNVISNASYSIGATIEGARSYAIANNTYTWVGFYEEDANAAGPTNTPPPYSRAGRVVVAVVASADGTKLLEDSSPPGQLPAGSLVQIGKLLKLDQVHLANIDPPAGGDPNSLDGRPELLNDPATCISSASADTTRYPFTANNYTFYKTLRFSPRGEMTQQVQGALSLQPIVEIGLQPTRGSVVNTNDKNVAAIQVNGLAGNVKIYRR